MLIEDFLSETYCIIPALKANYENARDNMDDLFWLFQKNDLVEQYYRIQGYNYINLTITENLEGKFKMYNDLVEDYYANK